MFLQRSATVRALTDRLAAPVPLPEALSAAQAEALHVVGATGAVVRLSGTLVCLGTTPSLPAVEFAVGSAASIGRRRWRGS